MDGERAARDTARDAGRGQILKVLSATLSGPDSEGNGKPMGNLKQAMICF